VAFEKRMQTQSSAYKQNISTNATVLADNVNSKE